VYLSFYKFSGLLIMQVCFLDYHQWCSIICHFYSDLIFIFCI